MLAVTAVPVAWSRDFAVFFLAGLYLVAAAIVVVFCCVVAVYAGHGRRARPALTALVIALGTPAIFIGVHALDHDRVGFAFWAPFHATQIKVVRSHDGIPLWWDSWGFAGMENDAYLVADRSETLGASGGLVNWATQHRSPCTPVAAERMRPRLYIVVTANCTL